MVTSSSIELPFTKRSSRLVSVYGGGPRCHKNLSFETPGIGGSTILGGGAVVPAGGSAIATALQFNERVAAVHVPRATRRMINQHLLNG
jgi:hypothetical protein